MAKPIKFTDRNARWAQRSFERTVDERHERERILIVCEGSKTEPNYFESLKKKLPKQVANIIDIDGQGFNTLSLVERAQKIRDSKKGTDYPYDETWVVFDRDSFDPDQFDNAIHKAEAMGMKSAWSNEAFELWYILHFEDRQTGMNRTEYKRCLTKHLDIPYEKNDPEMYSKLTNLGNESKAIQRARNLQSQQVGIPNHKANPCTKVNELVEKLNSFRTKQPKKFR